MLNLSKKARLANADLHEQLWRRTSERVTELDHKASEMLETLLKLSLHPDAFAVLKRFHCDVDPHLGYGSTFQDALNLLGEPDGIEDLQRTLRQIKKEHGAADKSNR